MDKLMKQKKNRHENEFPPISLIDVIFILLIFFFLTQVAITGVENGLNSGSKVKEGAKVLDLPAVSIDAPIVEKKKIDGVRILIQKSESNFEILEYFLLGYDNEQDVSEKRNISEDDLRFAKAWQDTVELDKEDDKKLIDSNRYINEGINYIKRYGIVPTESDSIERHVANLKLFFKHIKEFDKFNDITALDVTIKADESVNIGFINDIMTICGANSIAKVSFILKKKFQS